jgi:hypothetical protein
MLTPDQIKKFRQSAIARGFSESQISSEIARKNQELARVKSTPETMTPAPATTPVKTVVTPVKEKKSLGGLVKNAAQDVVDFAVNTPIQAAKNLAGVGFEGARAVTSALTKKQSEKKRKELEELNKKIKSEKDSSKKKLLSDKAKLLSNELGNVTKKLEQTNKVNPFTGNESPNLKDFTKGVIKNVVRPLGLELDENGKVVFNLQNVIDSAYEKPVTTALVGKDLIAGGKTALGKTSKVPAATKEIGALEKVGTKMRRDVLNPKTEVSPFASEQAASLQKIQEKLGLKGSAKAQLEQLPELFRKTSEEVQTALKKAKNPKKGTLSEQFLKEVDEANYNIDDPQFSKAVENEINILGKLDGKSAIEQYKMLEKYRSLLKSTRKKIDRGNTILPKEEARLAAFNALKSSIDEISPDIRALNTLQNQMYNLSEGLIKSTNKKGPGLTIAGTRIGIPNEVAQRLQDKAGKLLQATPKVEQYLSKFKPNIQGEPGTGIGMAASKVLTDDNQDMPVQSNEVLGEDVVSDNTDSIDFGMGQTQQELHPVFGAMSKQEVLQDAFKKGLNSKQLDEIETLYDRFAPEGKGNLKLSDTAIKSITDIRSALKDIDNLKTEINETDLVGPIKGLAAKNPYATDSRQLQAVIDRVKQTVGKALEGGVLRKEDEEKYKKILPVITDTKEVALRKIAELERTMKSNVEDYIYVQQAYGKGSEGTTADDLLGL